MTLIIDVVTGEAGPCGGCDQPFAHFNGVRIRDHLGRRLCPTCVTELDPEIGNAAQALDEAWDAMIAVSGRPEFPALAAAMRVLTRDASDRDTAWDTVTVAPDPEPDGVRVIQPERLTPRQAWHRALDAIEQRSGISRPEAQEVLDAIYAAGVAWTDAEEAESQGLRLPDVDAWLRIMLGDAHRPGRGASETHGDDEGGQTHGGAP